jgi:hypothetical protein
MMREREDDEREDDESERERQRGAMWSTRNIWA